MENLITAKHAQLLTQNKKDVELEIVISALNRLIVAATGEGETRATFRTKNKGELDLAIKYLRFAGYAIEAAFTTTDPWSMDGPSYTQEFSWPQPIQKSFS